MQDRISANSMKVLLQRTAGPYIWVKMRKPRNEHTRLPTLIGAVETAEECRYCCKSRRGAAVEFKFETIEPGRAYF
jgi:hypothetical protein